MIKPTRIDWQNQGRYIFVSHELNKYFLCLLLIFFLSESRISIELILYETILHTFVAKCFNEFIPKFEVSTSFS